MRARQGRLEDDLTSYYEDEDGTRKSNIRSSYGDMDPNAFIEK